MPCALARSSVLTSDAVVDRGQLDHRPDGILRLGRHPHAANCATDLAANRPDDGPPSTHDYPRHLLPDPLAHRRHHRQPRHRTAAIEQAARDGAQIVVLPELASSGYVFADRAELESLAETRDGPAITEWANLARRSALTIVAGFPEAAGDKVYNSAAVVDPTGLRGVYRKAHLWDTENAVFDRADDLPLVVDTDARSPRRDGLLRHRIPRVGARGGAAGRRPAVRAGELAAAATARTASDPTEQVRALAGAGMNRMADRGLRPRRASNAVRTGSAAA